MKKQDLLKHLDEDLLERLFGFCYARTNDSHEAEELCSDILYALVKAAGRGGEIESVYPFIWKVARNVYADFSDGRRRRAETVCEGDPEALLRSMAEKDDPDDSLEQLTFIYRRIAFLTGAYREVMILFYIEGLSVAEIARKQGISEGAVRQRLFSARQKIKNEVDKMADTHSNKPVALDNINFIIIGTGNPFWGDPRTVCTRRFSRHIVWLCRKRPMSASEIAEELNVPTVYVEEELEILRRGENGTYGLLRRLDNGRYALNFVLLDKDVFEKANAIYMEHLPAVCDTAAKYIEAHKAEYLGFPYLNERVDMNLILWQQVRRIAYAFERSVQRALEREYFSDISRTTDRPFSVYGYVDNGRYYGCGQDGIEAHHVCGYAHVRLQNIYLTRVQAHFHCGHNLSNDPLLQLALRAIGGMDTSALSEDEKEHAAKAVECGYLYRDGGRLYTKLLVSDDSSDEFALSDALQNGYFDAEAGPVAEKLAVLLRRAVPEHLLGEWTFANALAGLPLDDAMVEGFIQKGLLIPPANGIGAEGCWMKVKK